MFIKTLKFSLVVLAIISISADEIETIELEPGLWTHSHTISVVGKGVVHEETSQSCITEAKASPSVEMILADILEGDCDMANFIHTPGEARLDATCRNHDDQAVSTGTIKVNYSRSAYTAKADVVITGPGGSSDVTAVTQANHIGDCP